MTSPALNENGRKSSLITGPWIPTASLHVLQFVLAASLCLLVLESPFWRGVGLLLSAGGTLAPAVVNPWWVLLLLAVSQLWRIPSALDFTFHALLAGTHALYVLGSLLQWLPWRGRLVIAALALPLRRFVLIQAFSQSVAAFTLHAFSNERSTVNGLSLIAAAVLGILALMFARGIRRTAPND